MEEYILAIRVDEQDNLFVEYSLEERVDDPVQLRWSDGCGTKHEVMHLVAKVLNTHVKRP